MIETQRILDRISGFQISGFQIPAIQISVFRYSVLIIHGKSNVNINNAGHIPPPRNRTSTGPMSDVL
jgi:hypothetical protein